MDESPSIWPTFRLTPGQAAHIQTLKRKSFIAEWGSSRRASVRYALESYRYHRRQVQKAAVNDGEADG